MKASDGMPLNTAGAIDNGLVLFQQHAATATAQCPVWFFCIFVLVLMFSFTRSVIDVVRVGLWLHYLWKGSKVGKLHALQPPTPRG